MHTIPPADPASESSTVAVSSSSRRPFTWRRMLVFTVIATGIFFVGLEFALRAIYPQVRTATLPETMIRSHLDAPGLRYDPDLYWYWSVLPIHGIQINEFGFRRVKGMTAAKPLHTTRVITLGDSQTMGAGVTADQTYSAFAEEALGPGWEVLNAGISGYRTLNIYRLLQLRLAYFNPDIIVIDCMPFDSPRDDGPLEGIPLHTTTQYLQSLLWGSAIYYTLQLLIDKVRPEKPRWLDQPPSVRSGNSRNQGNHGLILEWAKKRKIQVVFMEYPVWAEFTELVDCQTRPGELPGGVPIVPACQALRNSGRPASTLFQDRNHLTVEGNQRVGKVLAETLLPLKRR